MMKEYPSSVDVMWSILNGGKDPRKHTRYKIAKFTNKLVINPWTFSGFLLALVLIGTILEIMGLGMGYVAQLLGII